MSDEPKKPGEDELPDGEESGEGQPEGAPAELDPEGEAAAQAKAEAEAKAKAEAAAKAKAAAEAKAAEEAAKPPWEKLPVAPEDEDASGDPLVAALGDAHPAAVEGAFVCGGDLRVHVARAAIADVCQSLKDSGYTMVEDLCGVHYPDREGREFEVVYHLFNIAENRRVRLKVAVAEGESVPTTALVFKGMNWLEREAYDMYGIRFEGHPDMTRILLWEGFNGHPLRKDFPVEGIDTGAAIYPEYYDQSAGPVAGTGTGWKPQPPPEPEEAAPPAEEGEG